MPNLINLQDAIVEIKTLIENAITSNGERGKRSIINSGKPINLIHDAIKSELIKNGVNEHLIRPTLGQSKGELRLAGFLKLKTQDICVIPNHLEPN